MKAEAIVLALAIWMAACATRADGPPEIVVDRTACSHCGMLISEPAYAAAFRTDDGSERVFDDIGCLLAAVRKSPVAGGRFWFHAADGSGWVDGASAVFVKSHALRTPMGGGIIAVRTRAAADEAARRHEGSIVPGLGALLAANGGHK